MTAPALILAPVGRDAASIAGVIADMGLDPVICADLDEACERIGPEARLLVVAEEGLAGGIEDLRACLDAQPAWCDFPIVLLAVGGSRRGSEARWNLFERLGNVLVLDRPLHVRSLQGAVRAALRSRARQYLAREHMEALEAARSGLEQRVAERTRELEEQIAERRRVEEALVRSQRLEAVGQLTGGVAHDFNNLLQIVLGYVTFLERHGANAERRATALDAIRQAGERGAHLTRQLLAFARRQPLAAEPIDVADRIEDMRELLQGALRADMSLRIRLAPDLWPVATDLTQLEVALLNLVVNARDASHAGSEIVVKARNVSLASDGIDDLDGDYVQISVEDKGQGMDGETLKRAFEPFFTTKEGKKGTGLGLSQVYGFARQSGGGVRIESIPGDGTVVQVFLPRSDGTPVVQAEERPAGSSHDGGCVLVVEDEDEIASLACGMLEELGYCWVRASNAEEALRQDLSRFTAVFSDVIMPGPIDGIAAAQEIRRRCPELPILLATGFAGSPERLADLPFPVLRKPYRFEQFSAALSAALTKSKSSASGHDTADG